VKNIYAIRDLTAGVQIGGLFLHPHHAPAVRFFGDIASDPQTMIARHPAEHDLVCIGTFDEESCMLAPYSRPEVVITGAAWKAAQAPTTEP